LRVLGPDVVGMANNHTFDFGEEPMNGTLLMLEKDGFRVIGAGKNTDAAYRPAVFEKDGVKVSVTAVNENEFGCSADDKPGSAGYSLTRVTAAIQSARERGEAPVIFFHGGNEQDPFPSPGKRELYRHFIDIGAEAVVAAHTHCPQGMEYYREKPVVYSLGNFFFPESATQKESWRHGYLCTLNIENGKTAAGIDPYRFDENGVKMLSGEEKEKFREYFDFISAPIKDEKLLEDLFDAWCMTSFSYAKKLGDFRVEMINDDSVNAIKSIKNVLGCEAHNELVRNTMYMIFERRVAAADRLKHVYGELQEMRTVPLGPTGEE
ncbi:MAG: CapA family protein, partial [Clostridia bacterium]|nr:CapA family protein [Clostridia bacterium]